VTTRDDLQEGGSFIDLPVAVDVESPFDVFINGVLQEYGTDYELDGRTLVFPRRLAPEIALTKLQFLRAALGIAGTYRKHDSIDITYEHDGRKLVATGLRPRPPDDVQTGQS
jgi:hypothetical protein